jgi:hypothetical protein
MGEMVSIEARYHATCLITLLQIFIKAVIRSNRTFINCERLSSKGLESKLKSRDGYSSSGFLRYPPSAPRRHCLVAIQL